MCKNAITQKILKGIEHGSWRMKTSQYSAAKLPIFLEAALFSAARASPVFSATDRIPVRAVVYPFPDCRPVVLGLSSSQFLVTYIF